MSYLALFSLVCWFWPHARDCTSGFSGRFYSHFLVPWVFAYSHCRLLVLLLIDATIVFPNSFAWAVSCATLSRCLGRDHAHLCCLGPGHVHFCADTLVCGKRAALLCLVRIGSVFLVFWAWSEHTGPLQGPWCMHVSSVKRRHAKLLHVVITTSHEVQNYVARRRRHLQVQHLYWFELNKCLGDMNVMIKPKARMSVWSLIALALLAFYLAWPAPPLPNAAVSHMRRGNFFYFTPGSSEKSHRIFFIGNSR